MTTSNKNLSATDIEKKIQSFPFPREGYQPRSYDYATKGYVDSGPYIEPFTETMEDGEIGWSDFVEELDDWATKEGEPKPSIFISGVGSIFLEKQFGGEGQGDQYWFVIRVENDGDPDRFFRMDGWYASYDGGEYDGDLREVNPLERTVVVYE